MTAEDRIYEAVSDYLTTLYKEQAAEEGIEWTQEHNEHVQSHADSLYDQVGQAITIYTQHFLDPLPDFSEDE